MVLQPNKEIRELLMVSLLSTGIHAESTPGGVTFVSELSFGAGGGSGAGC